MIDNCDNNIMATSSRATRTRNSKKQSISSALQDMRAVKDGRIRRADQFEIGDEGNIYETVNEHEYSQLRAGRQRGDDFVVDDNGAGYLDDGGEIFDEDAAYDTEDDLDAKDKSQQLGKKKDASGRKKAKRVTQGKGIHAFFKDVPVVGSNTIGPNVIAKNASLAREDGNGDDILKAGIATLLNGDDDLESTALSTTPTLSRPFSKRPHKQKRKAAGDPLPKLSFESILHGDLTDVNKALSFNTDDTDVATVSPRKKTRYEPSLSMESIAAPLSPEPKHNHVKKELSLDLTHVTECCEDEMVDTAPVPYAKEEAEECIKAFEAPASQVEVPTQRRILELPNEDELADDANAALMRRVEANRLAALERAALSKTSHEKSVSTMDWATACSTAGEVRNDRALSDSSVTPMSPSLLNKSSTTLPLTKLEDGDMVLDMFWLDAVEEPMRPGVIYIIGKVWDPEAGAYASCCVVVNKIERNLFLLPREVRQSDDDESPVQVTLQDVYKEFDALADTLNINNWRAKGVERRYAFELPDVPVEGTYLKVTYTAEQPKVPDEKRKGNTYSHIFGTNTSALEMFLKKRKLRGPCWLRISNVTVRSSAVTWCKFEADCVDPKDIEITPVDAEARIPETIRSPPAVVMSLSIKTVMDPRTHKNEVAMVAGIVHRGIDIEGASPDLSQGLSSFVLVRRLSDRVFPYDWREKARQMSNTTDVKVLDSERALLSLLLVQLHKVDPDVLLGHNFVNFDLDVLLHRCLKLKIGMWSKLGRLRRTDNVALGKKLAQHGNAAEKVACSGRLVMDMFRASKEFIRAKAYSLTELAQTQLGVIREDIDVDEVANHYDNSDSLRALCEHTCHDAWLAVRLMVTMCALPLSLNLTRLAGNVWSLTMSHGRAKRNEFLLLHEFHERKFITPDVQTWAEAQAGRASEKAALAAGASKRKKPAYEGGLVLEPHKGFYDKFVLLLDFNSLYPSIIQEYNLCFTTVERPSVDEIPSAVVTAAVDEDDYDGERIVTSDDVTTPVRLADLPAEDLERGVLPGILSHLVERRRTVKNLIKKERDTHKLAQYDIRQKALKLTANSMYGCLGFTQSRFYARPIAELITRKGREILQATVDLATEKGFDVIYGDTDSIMINTNSTDLTEVKRIGNMIKMEVNKMYKLLEIDIDGVFQSMLLLKKKKYAALVVEEKDGVLQTTRETKGLDMVRRDWCDLSHDVGNHILNLILQGLPREELVDAIHAHLRQIAEDVTADRIPINKYVINKGLTKLPKDYADKSSQPHVQVAMRMLSKGRCVQAGDTIPYIICEGDQNLSFALRAYHPDDIDRSNGTLKVDTLYYIKQQVCTVVGRLVQHIEGTNAMRVAECLGLNPSHYRVTSGGSGDASVDGSDEHAYLGMDSQLTDDERFAQCTPLEVLCPNCKNRTTLQQVFNDSENGIKLGLECGTCNSLLPVAAVSNALTIAVRKEVESYYAGRMSCDDPACMTHTRCISVVSRQCPVPGCQGKLTLDYSDKRIYTQLCFFAALFDVERAMKQLSSDTARQTARNVLSQTPDAHDDLNKLLTIAQSHQEKCARRYVSLASVFKHLSF